MSGHTSNDGSNQPARSGHCVESVAPACIPVCTLRNYQSPSGILSITLGAGFLVSPMVIFDLIVTGRPKEVRRRRTRQTYGRRHGRGD